MTSDLSSRLAQTNPRLLLPAQAASPPDRLELAVAVPLPSPGHDLALILATDPAGSAHLVPVVDDPTGLRRARPGDGVAGAVLELLRAGGTAPGHQVRRGTAVASTGSAADEHHLADASDREVYAVGDQRVCLYLEPERFDTPPPDVIGELDRTGFRGVLPWLGDLVVTTERGGYDPVVRASRHPAGARLLSDQLIGLVADHLRGGHEAIPTLEVAGRVGRELAALHLALGSIPSPGSAPAVANDDDVAGWRRGVSDAFAEAVVLAEGEAGERLRSRRAEVRAALDGVSASAGAPLLPALPVPGPAAFVVSGPELLLDPLATPLPDSAWRSPVRDLAAMVRGVDHLARSVHRRLVASGFPAPLERMSSWFEAVRAEVLGSYRVQLASAGAADLVDERLLLAFEVEAECRSLSRASRFLSTARGISDAALVDLLSAR